MNAANGPQTAFLVGSTRVGDTGIGLEQHLTGALVDHRGVVEMPAYAVMAESVTSGAYWYTFDEPVATVQSWLALTAGAPAEVGDRLVATARLAHHDDHTGTATMTMTNQSGGVVCSGVARAMRVGRTTEALQALTKDTVWDPVDSGGAAHPGAGQGAAPGVPVAPLDPGWDGRRILAAIGSGTIARGPLCELLAMTVGGGAEPVLTVDPQPWMANPLGAIQGGVIASIVGQACSLAGQAHTAPGDRYTLADLSIFYFRSPPVDGRPLTVVTATERVGRRMATVSATLADGPIGATGTTYARAVADIAYRRAGAF